LKAHREEKTSHRSFFNIWPMKRPRFGFENGKGRWLFVQNLFYKRSLLRGLFENDLELGGNSRILSVFIDGCKSMGYRF